MTEVTEVCEPDAAIVNDVRNLRDVERLIRKRVRTVAEEEEDDRTADRSEERRHRGVDAPVRRTDRVHEIRRRLSERERADENTKRETSSRAKPGGDDLHPRRIDAGEKDAGGESKRDRCRSGVDERSKEGVHRRTGERGEREEMPYANDVGKIEQRAGERSRHKADLHGKREPRRGRRIELPLDAQPRRDRGHAEPERHAEEQGNRQEDERGPTPHFWRTGMTQTPCAGSSL